MKRIAIFSVTMTAFLLSACASESQPIMTAQVKRAVTPPGGVWEVTQAVAIDPKGAGKAPFIGQRLALYEKSAGTPAGQSCAAPEYMGWEGTAATVIGTSAKSDEVRPVMEVTCAGQPFGLYVGMADGTLMTRIDNWVLTLKRTAATVAAPKPATAKTAEKPAKTVAEKSTAPVPVAEPAKPVATAKAEPVKAEPAKAETTKPEKMKKPANKSEKAPVPVQEGIESPSATGIQDKRTVVYLASYKSEKMAKAGWKVLAKKSAILSKQEPIINQVELAAKGSWYRLYGMAADEAERTALCAQLGKLVDECGSRLRE